MELGRKNYNKSGSLVKTFYFSWEEWIQSLFSKCLQMEFETNILQPACHEINMSQCSSEPLIHAPLGAETGHSFRTLTTVNRVTMACLHWPTALFSLSMLATGSSRFLYLVLWTRNECLLKNIRIPSPFKPQFDINAKVHCTTVLPINCQPIMIILLTRDTNTVITSFERINHIQTIPISSLYLLKH